MENNVAVMDPKMFPNMPEFPAIQDWNEFLKKKDFINPKPSSALNVKFDLQNQKGEIIIRDNTIALLLGLGALYIFGKFLLSR